MPLAQGHSNTRLPQGGSTSATPTILVLTSFSPSARWKIRVALSGSSVSDCHVAHKARKLSGLRANRIHAPLSPGHTLPLPPHPMLPPLSANTTTIRLRTAAVLAFTGGTNETKGLMICKSPWWQSKRGSSDVTEPAGPPGGAASGHPRSASRVNGTINMAKMKQKKLGQLL